jgi:putative autotransporter/adhesin
MQKTVDKGSACCLTTTFRSCEHELERSRRKMTNKKFKLAAMSLATAVAVSAVGPSASAVTYYLGDGSVTVDKDDTRGAYSYQGEDGSEEHRTYVNEDKAETGDGTIYVKDGNAPTGEVPPSTDNSNNGTEETTPTDNDTQSTDASGNNTENSSTSETTTGNTITVMEDVKKKDVQGRWYRRQ